MSRSWSSVDVSTAAEEDGWLENANDDDDEHGDGGAWNEREEDEEESAMIFVFRWRKLMDIIYL